MGERVVQKNVEKKKKKKKTALSFPQWEKGPSLFEYFFLVVS